MVSRPAVSIMNDGLWMMVFSNISKRLVRSSLAFFGAVHEGQLQKFVGPPYSILSFTLTVTENFWDRCRVISFEHVVHHSVARWPHICVIMWCVISKMMYSSIQDEQAVKNWVLDLIGQNKSNENVSCSENQWNIYPLGLQALVYCKLKRIFWARLFLLKLKEESYNFDCFFQVSTIQTIQPRLFIWEIFLLTASEAGKIGQWTKNAEALIGGPLTIRSHWNRSGGLENILPWIVAGRLSCFYRWTIGHPNSTTWTRCRQRHSLAYLQSVHVVEFGSIFVWFISSMNQWRIYL
jgi:hypothetical protein